MSSKYAGMSEFELAERMCEIAYPVLKAAGCYTRMDGNRVDQVPYDVARSYAEAGIPMPAELRELMDAYGDELEPMYMHLGFRDYLARIPTE